MHRRRLIAAGTALLVPPTWAIDAEADRAAQVLERWRALGASAPDAPTGPLPPQQAARMVERSALLASGETKLAAGDSEAAIVDFDRAASMLHAADSEMSLVRAWMQQGEYRRAVAFVAHTAQAHRQAVGGAVLYGWLLSRGGQDAVARRMLEGAGEIGRGDPLLVQARELFDRPAALPERELLTPPLRLAPYAVGVVPPRGARVVAAAVLLADGRHALTCAEALRGTRALWLRNGLGQTVKAGVAPHRSGGGSTPGREVVALRLEAGLPSVPDDMPAADPFPGSPGCVLVHPPDRLGRAAWPRLHAGFHGMPDEVEPDRRRLGIDLPATPAHLHGGPVFDAAGRWVGVALPHADGSPRAAMRSVLSRSFGPLVAPPPSSRPAPAPRAPLDEIYERALRTTLQVIAAG